MKFHNPYNFVRTPARDKKVLENSFAGDYDPSNAERCENFSIYWAERYTGEISVKLRTSTPLFITAPGTKRESQQVEGHYIYDCVKEIPATSLKGMLSSAYEIITNSRYRVFSEKQHSRCLGFRGATDSSLVPGRIREKDGKFYVTLFTGTSRIGSDKAIGPLYAAWLPAYRGGRSIIPDNIRNGMYCSDVELGLYSYSGKPFKVWSVMSIGDINFQPISTNLRNCEETIRANGYVVISGKIFGRKHDERFFFNSGSSTELEISETVRRHYEALIADYQTINHPPNDSGVVFGEHIETRSMRDLKDGDFVYVKTDGVKAEALYPVQISRKLNPVSPWECLDDSLKPADSISKLSPADRLFGWISQNGTGSWKGKIQISSGKYESSDGNPDPVEHFEKHLTLSILGEPNPSQARFYLGNQDGTPQNNGISRDNAAYGKNKHIRGRKIYIHHTLHYLKKEEREHYWRPFNADGLRREYKLSPEPSNQNRSITGWIPAKRTFSFKIRVENLTREELGALLILFSFENECCFRLGYGKPLGFGSVRLSLDGDIALATGSELSERYKNLLTTKKYSLPDYEREKCIKSYQRAMTEAYSNGTFEEIKAPDVLSFAPEGYGDLNDEQKKEFHSVWLSALESDDENAPTDKLPEKEYLLEVCSPGYFDEKYKADLKAWREYKKQYRKNDFGWGKLDFIKSFFASMKGFEEPVRYPTSPKKTESFQWFVMNEKITGGKCPGYSLPAIGKTLEEL